MIKLLNYPSENQEFNKWYEDLNPNAKVDWIKSNPDSFLLDKLIQEVNLANDGCTTLQEFALTVMQWTDAIDKVHRGLESIPDNWIE